MDDRLYRSRSDRSLAGVCGGLAAWLGLDPSLVRIGWVLLTLVSGGIFLVLYIVMAVVVPEAPPGWAPRGRRAEPGPGSTWAPSGTWGPGPAAPGAPSTGVPPEGPPGTAAPGAPPPPGGAWTAAQGGWAAGPTPPPGQGAGAPGPTSWPEDWSRAPGTDMARTGERAGIVVGAVLVVVGVWMLVRDYIPINWDLVWPVAVIALGAVLIVGAARRR